MVAIPRLSANVLEASAMEGRAAGAKPLVHVVENRSGIITVAADGTVFGNGMYDGRFNTDLKHDTNGIVRPYALSLFHPAPRDVLMIGLSSGSWAQVIANNPEVASLTVVEINPGYLTLIAQAPEVASVLSNPKVTIVTDDGRRWLRANPNRRFDAIVSNTTWYFRANVTNLLSAEFLDLIKQPSQSGRHFLLQHHQFRRVQRTACLAFADGARFTNHMVVSDAPIALGFCAVADTLEAYRIDRPAGVRSLAQRRIAPSSTSSRLGRPALTGPQMIRGRSSLVPISLPAPPANSPSPTTIWAASGGILSDWNDRHRPSIRLR